MKNTKMSIRNQWGTTKCSKILQTVGLNWSWGKKEISNI